MKNVMLLKNQPNLFEKGVRYAVSSVQLKLLQLRVLVDWKFNAGVYTGHCTQLIDKVIKQYE